VLLAAGVASRFGADKLLHPLPDGAPLALRSARNLVAALPRSVAVVRDADGVLAGHLRAAGLGIAPCARCAEGMGASLACGVAAARADGWIIALADMPFVRPDTIARVAAALVRGAPIAAPAFHGRRGHPVGFGRRFRDELLALSGDTGARGVLAAHPGDIMLLDCDDAGVLRDIDVPQDLDAPDAAPRRDAS
jgi:molybdenum cofactor cytidylyltransferase